MQPPPEHPVPPPRHREGSHKLRPRQRLGKYRIEKCLSDDFEVTTTRKFADQRYTATCDNRKCSRRELMPFMKYCPWCHRLTRKKWKIDGSRDTCSSCQSGIVRTFWSFCPWCSKKITAK